MIYMYKKNVKNKKLITSLIISILVILLVFSIILNRKINFIENFSKSALTVIEKVIMYPFTALNNDKSIKQSESYLIQKNVNTSLEKEIKELKEVLDLNKTLTEYQPINATILSRNKSYWFNTISIDKGEKSGIKENMAVITKNGFDDLKNDEITKKREK